MAYPLNINYRPSHSPTVWGTRPIQLHPSEIMVLDKTFKSANGLAYTLLDLKPASTGGLAPTAFAALSKIVSSKFLVASLGHDRFIPNKIDVLILNKSLCEKMINAYYWDFKQKFPLAANAAEIISAIYAAPATLMQDHYLLGILLGYGQHNAQLYNRLIQLKDVLAQTKETDKLYPSLSQQCAQLERLLKGSRIGETSPFKDATMISFRVDPSHPETQILLNHYQKAFQFLDSTLRQQNSVYSLIQAAQSNAVNLF